MADAALPLRAAINVAVAADSALTALGVTMVRDHVPDHTDLQNFTAYTAFTGTSAEPYNANGVLGQQTTIEITTWTRERGTVTAHRIAAAMRDCLERATLSVTGHQFVACWFDGLDIEPTGDGVTAFASQQFRFITHE